MIGSGSRASKRPPVRPAGSASGGTGRSPSTEVAGHGTDGATNGATDDGAFAGLFGQLPALVTFGLMGFGQLNAGFYVSLGRLLSLSLKGGVGAKGPDVFDCTRSTPG